MTDGTEYGCLDCMPDYYRTWQVEEGEIALFCPYCGNRSFIEAGEEWDEILERDDVQK
jgi:DNA-directed RNA polymerase subunit RPC12/RpoP